MESARQSLKDKLYAEIKGDILTGKYEAHERLVLAALAEQYGVSKTPARDALQALHREGLVEIIPRVGYFVTAMTLKDMVDIFELRRVLECAAVELAIQRITDDEIDQLAAIDLNYTPGDLESCVRYLRHHREFHYRMASASGNTWLANYVGELLDHVQRFIFVHLNMRDWNDDLREEHDRLIQALRDRDALVATREIVEQAEATQQALVTALT